MIGKNFFRALLVAQVVAVGTYTVLVFEKEGADLWSVFLNNIASLNWSGQFNLDFLCYLLLSGSWIMWRNQFEKGSTLFAIAAMILGIVVFAPYLLWLFYKEKGDLKRVLIGNRSI